MDDTGQGLELDLEMHKNYDTLEAFVQAGEREDLLKVVVISLPGTGKSSLCCKLVGVHLVQDDLNLESGNQDSGYGILR